MRHVKILFLFIAVFSILLLFTICCSNSEATLEILNLSSSKTTAVIGDSVFLQVDVDYDGDNNISYIWTSTGGAFYGLGEDAIWIAPTTMGIYTLTLLVSDGEIEDEESIDIEVTDSLLRLISLTAFPDSIGRGGLVSLTSAVFYGGENILSYIWSSDVGSFSGSGSSVSWFAPMITGTYTVGLRVTDGNYEAEDSISIVVHEGQVDTVLNIVGLSVTPICGVFGDTLSLVANVYYNGGGALSYNWTYNGGSITGSGAEVGWVVPNVEGTYKIKLDVSAGELEDSDSVFADAYVTAVDITSLVAVPSSVDFGDTVSVTAGVIYTGSGTLTYLWLCDNGTILGSGNHIQWLAPSSEGDCQINLTVTDGAVDDEDSVSVEVVETPPVLEVLSLTATPSSLDYGDTTAINASVMYTGSGTLDYYWVCDGGTILGAGTSVQWIAPDVDGSYDIRFMVTDRDLGDEDTVSVYVTSGGGPYRIYIAERVNNRITRIDDMTGAGWVTYGSSGSGVGQFNKPMGIAVGPDNKICVMDQHNNRIVRVDDMTGAGWLSYGSSGSGVGGFSCPGHLAFTTDGKIIKGDGYNSQVVQMDDITGTGWTTLGDGGFSLPEGVAVGPDGKIYVADAEYDMIVRVDDISGSGWVSYGTTGTGIGEFTYLTEIAIGYDNKIYITDRDNNRIVRMDNMTGTGWVSYGTGGSGSGEFNGPHGITLGPDGKIYISDTQNHRIVRIDDMSGTGWISYGTSGSGEGEFQEPMGITVGP
jgi:streptogramin lyase